MNNMRLSRAFIAPPQDAKVVPGYLDVLLILLDPAIVGVDRVSGEVQSNAQKITQEVIENATIATIELGCLPIVQRPDGKIWIPTTQDLNAAGKALVAAATQLYDDHATPLPMALFIGANAPRSVMRGAPSSNISMAIN